MEEVSKNIITVNNKEIIHRCIDGKYWMSILSLCEALEINYNRQYQNILKDPLLAETVSNISISRPGKQRRKYTCLPEELVYAWIFSIRSNSEALIRYKKRVFDLFFRQFTGVFTRRAKLHKMIDAERERIELLKLSLEDSVEFVELKEASMREARLWKALRSLKDIEEINP